MLQWYTAFIIAYHTIIIAYHTWPAHAHKNKSRSFYSHIVLGVVRKEFIAQEEHAHALCMSGCSCEFLIEILAKLSV